MITETQRIFKKPKTKPYYVNGKEFTKAIEEYVIEYKKLVEKHITKNEDPKNVRLKASEYIGECILKICTGVSYMPNFRNYSYRDEMVDEAVIQCIRKIHNYDSSKCSATSNAFTYVTQVAYRAMQQVLKKEKKQRMTKYKFMTSMDISEFADHISYENNDDMKCAFGGIIKDIAYEQLKKMTVKKKYVSKDEKIEFDTISSLCEFIDVDVE